MSAVLLLALMYLASSRWRPTPSSTTTSLALTIAALGLLGAGDVYGLGRSWKALPIVARNHWLG